MFHNKRLPVAQRTPPPDKEAVLSSLSVFLGLTGSWCWFVSRDWRRFSTRSFTAPQVSCCRLSLDSCLPSQIRIKCLWKLQRRSASVMFNRASLIATRRLCVGKSFWIFGALAAIVGITHQYTPEIKGLNVPDVNICSSEDSKLQHLVFQLTYFISFYLCL